MINEKKYASTYERLIHEDPDFQKDLEKSYKEFILSEFTLMSEKEYEEMEVPHLDNETFKRELKKFMKENESLMRNLAKQ